MLDDVVLLMDDGVSDIWGSDWEVVLWLDDDFIVEQIGHSRVIGNDVRKIWHGLDYVLCSIFVVLEVWKVIDLRVWSKSVLF